MSTSGLDVFDKTLQTTHLWLDEIIERVGPDKRDAWHILGAVLRTLRDRLPLGLTVHLGAQLPLLVRGLYYEQWHPRSKPLKLRSAKQFLDEVSKALEGTRPVTAEEAAAAVFQVLNHYLDPGQISNVRAALSEPVRRLWPENAQVRDKKEEAEV